MGHKNDLSYIAAIERWRQQREADLRAPNGWLALTGLFVLTEGRHTIGSASDNDILLPGSAPAHLGEILFEGGKTALTVTTDAAVSIDGAPRRAAYLVDNGDHKQPTLVTIGAVTFFVHHFGDQYAIRVKDSENPAIRSFGGCRWYAVKPEYRVQGRLTPFAHVREEPIGTVVNTTSVYRSVGAVEFILHGQPLRLLVTNGGAPGQFSAVLRDTTAGLETYAPARFLTVDVGIDGAVDVDFNKAYNPPCAFTPYATCPLPPPANILPVRIEAGELFTPAAEDVSH